MAQPPKSPYDWMIGRDSAAGSGRGGARPAAPGAPATAPSPKTTQAPEPRTSNIGHPGFAESLIPVWGSGREAIAEWEEGDYVSALINAGLAASDVFVVGAIRNGIAKGLVRKTPTGWKTTRRWLEKQGFVRHRDEAHHAFVPQGRWGKTWPVAVRDHPLNIKSLPQDVHRRITGKWGTQSRYNEFDRFWHGTPTWTKVGIAGVGADSVQGLDDREHT